MEETTMNEQDQIDQWTENGQREPLEGEDETPTNEVHTMTIWTDLTSKTALAADLCAEYIAERGHVGGDDLRVVVVVMLSERGPRGARPTVAEIADEIDAATAADRESIGVDS